MQREPDREIQDDADDRGGDAGERARQRLVVAQALDKGRAEPDPQPTRHEGRPGREEAAQGAGEQRRQRAGIAVGGHKADELHDHDQGARRRLGHAEPVEHLAGPEPAIVLDCLLRHVGEHRIGAAESDDRHLREEQADIAEGVAEAEGREDRDHRPEPQCEPDRRNTQRASDGRPHMLREVLSEPALFGSARP